MTTSHQPSGPRPRGLRGRRLLIAACLAEVVSMLGFGTFPALMPTFFAEWGISNTEAGWINGIFFAAYMAAVPVLVSLTDRIDPRRVYLVGAAATALGSLGFALVADGFWLALTFRAMAGLGLAGTYMPGLKALTDHLPAPGRSRSVAFYTASFSIGSALSFLLAGEIAGAFGWRWAFGAAAAGPLAAMLVFLVLVPASAPREVAAPQGALLDFRPVLRNRSALGYVLAYSAHNWELFAFRSWIVAFLVFSQALQPAGSSGVTWSATALAALLNLLGLPASVLGNEAAQRLGRVRVVIVVMSASAAVALALGFLAPLPFLVVIAATVVYAVTVTADSASITAGAIEAAREGQRGATMAVHSFIGFAGAFVGPLVFGVVLDVAGGRESVLAWGLAFVSSALAVASGPVALALLHRRAGPMA